jgi:hypothetical protein
MTLDDWRHAVRTGRPPRLRDRRRRVLFGDLLRRGSAAARRAAGGTRAGRTGLPPADRVLQPVEALQRPGDALRLRRRRRAADQAFLLYRTYHGSAMSPAVQAASIAAWNDEAHVRDNRRLYREKFAAVHAESRAGLRHAMPDAGFYLWARVGDRRRRVRPPAARQYNVTVLPGSYLARDARASIRAAGFIRIALVGRPRMPAGRIVSSPFALKRLPAFALLQRIPTIPAIIRTNAMQAAQQIIEDAWENRTQLSPGNPRPPTSRSGRSRARRLDAAACASPRSRTATG